MDAWLSRSKSFTKKHRRLISHSGAHTHIHSALCCHLTTKAKVDLENAGQRAESPPEWTKFFELSSISVCYYQLVLSLQAGKERSVGCVFYLDGHWAFSIYSICLNFILWQIKMNCAFLLLPRANGHTLSISSLHSSESYQRNHLHHKNCPKGPNSNLSELKSYFSRIRIGQN